MINEQTIQTQNESQFRDIAFRVLEEVGFEPYSREKTADRPQAEAGHMKKDGQSYLVETFHSRRAQYTSRMILASAQNLAQQAKTLGCLPLIVVGGVLPTDLHSQLLGISLQTVILDVENLLHMAFENRELYDELVAQLPYSTADLRLREPDYLPLPDWNAAYAGKDDWQISAVALRPDPERTVAPGVVSGINDDDFIVVPDWDSWNDPADSRDEPKNKPNRKKPKSIGHGVDLGTSYASAIQLFHPSEADKLRKDIKKWQGGKQTNAAAYEKLCTRTLMRLFAEDLTLWNEQTNSNGNLYRFDLICKIKRDNHKDFWEMAERYFNSKYIIFEFKNYTGKVTQKEVYTTVRYLYPTALRRVAIIISPNGIDDHADRAIRGALRDEGKLIISLTNEDLVEMLRMKKDGEDPADYLSDKLDALLIDLEK